jgi:hypothetical protein
MVAPKTTLSLALAVVGLGASVALGASSAGATPSTPPPSPASTPAPTTAPSAPPTALPSGVPTTSTAPAPPIRVNAGGGPAVVRPHNSTDSDVLVEVGAGLAGAAGLVGLGLTAASVGRTRRRQAGAVAR